MIKKVNLKKERYLMFIDTETIGTLNVNWVPSVTSIYNSYTQK